MEMSSGRAKSVAQISNYPAKFEMLARRSGVHELFVPDNGLFIVMPVFTSEPTLSLIKQGVSFAEHRTICFKRDLFKIIRNIKPLQALKLTGFFNTYPSDGRLSQQFVIEKIEVLSD